MEPYSPEERANLTLLHRGYCMDMEACALHRAASSPNCLPALQYLLRKCKANPAVETKYGQTPLHLAACCGNLPGVETLLDHGAKLDVLNDYDMTPFSQACSYGHIDVVTFMAKRKANPNLAYLPPLHAACHGTSVPLLRLLVDLGYDINGTDDRDGNTPLMVACINNHHNLILELLQLGADVKCRNDVSTSLTTITTNA
eukprot:m.40800 g.40800  ORF g.40800 m.40800 type:complete len:200 (-) comp12781_c0_seq1:553-1152(-)